MATGIFDSRAQKILALTEFPSEIIRDSGSRGSNLHTKPRAFMGDVTVVSRRFRHSRHFPGIPATIATK
jgi:hypothetical protein